MRWRFRKERSVLEEGDIRARVRFDIHILVTLAPQNALALKAESPLASHTKYVSSFDFNICTSLKSMVTSFFV